MTLTDKLYEVFEVLCYSANKYGWCIARMSVNMYALLMNPSRTVDYTITQKFVLEIKWTSIVIPWAYVSI
jgi:hypothetical protein